MNEPTRQRGAEMTGEELREAVSAAQASIMKLQDRLGEAGLVELVKMGIEAEDLLMSIYWAIPCEEWEALDTDEPCESCGFPHCRREASTTPLYVRVEMRREETRRIRAASLR